MTPRSKDELFQILSNSRRRYIIYYLSEAGTELSLKELATKIAAAESDIPESRVSTEERQRVYISLYQTHLPKLEEARIASYDDEARTVALTDEAREQGFFWMDAGDAADEWYRYSLALALLGWALVVGVWLSLPLVSVLGWAGVAVVVAVGLTGLVVVQYLHRRKTDERSGYEPLVE
ncbi:DUF7344 domain-containing protein [Salinigranum sp. GCM10025319]|uniref:DUF7344 domain-containing protein n=1 Tax=Salinigranum sp. GCM10025319 TaxID=3252687 RepID=UPI00360FF42E